MNGCVFKRKFPSGRVTWGYSKSRNTRTIRLSEDAAQVLKRIKTVQDERRKMYGPDYRADLDLVFCHPDGEYIRPDTVTKPVPRLAKKAGFSRVSVHTLRHSHGSQLLSVGVPLPVVSKRLGHTDSIQPPRVHAHALESDEAAAAEKWEAAMEAADDKVVEMPTRKQA